MSKNTVLNKSTRINIDTAAEFALDNQPTPPGHVQYLLGVIDGLEAGMAAMRDSTAPARDQEDDE